MSILSNSARQDNQSKKHVNDFRRVYSAGRHALALNGTNPEFSI